jgi:anti-sigma factor RsiW
MQCETFRSTLQTGDQRPEILEHLRSCEGCLEYATTVDPDVLFRSLGGRDLVPPGGIDAFTSSVMHQVSLRQKEASMSAPRFTRLARWAAAAVAAGIIIGSSLFVGRPTAPAPVGAGSRTLVAAHASLAAGTQKPVIENYDSTSATIVEVPTEDASDVKVVMIFDDSLPADL